MRSRSLSGEHVRLPSEYYRSGLQCVARGESGKRWNRKRCLPSPGFLRFAPASADVGLVGIWDIGEVSLDVLATGVRPAAKSLLTIS